MKSNSRLVVSTLAAGLISCNTVMSDPLVLNDVQMDSVSAGWARVDISSRATAYGQSTIARTETNTFSGQFTDTFVTVDYSYGWGYGFAIGEDGTSASISALASAGGGDWNIALTATDSYSSQWSSLAYGWGAAISIDSSPP